MKLYTVSTDDVLNGISVVTTEKYGRALLLGDPPPDMLIMVKLNQVNTPEVVSYDLEQCVEEGVLESFEVRGKTYHALRKPHSTEAANKIALVYMSGATYTAAPYWGSPRLVATDPGGSQRPQLWIIPPNSAVVCRFRAKVDEVTRKAVKTMVVYNADGRIHREPYEDFLRTVLWDWLEGVRKSDAVAVSSRDIGDYPRGVEEARKAIKDQVAAASVDSRGRIIIPTDGIAHIV